MRTWELKFLRIMFKMRRGSDEGAANYNTRTAHRLKEWFSFVGALMIHERILEMLHENAWREIGCTVPGKDQPLRWVREHRDCMWWEAVKTLPYRTLKAEGLEHAKRGRRAACEDPLVRTYGIDWRSKRKAYRGKTSWQASGMTFVQQICEAWHLPITHTRSRYETVSINELVPSSKRTLSNIPCVKPHPNDDCWDRSCGCLSMVVDCQVLYGLLQGEVVLKDVASRPIFVRIARALERFWKTGWQPRQAWANFIEWRPREFNNAADHLANYTLDEAKSWFECEEEVLREGLARGCNIELHSDGGLRRQNKEEQRCCQGSSAWIGHIVHLKDGTWHRKRFAMAGTYLEDASSAFVAEAIALEKMVDYVVSVL